MIRAALAILVAVVLGVAAGQSCAHDAHDWIRKGGYRSPATAEWCCGQDDCVAVPASDVEAAGPGWRILPAGETIPYREALPSEDGRFWRCHRPDGSRRCFFAPPGTS